MANRWDSRPLWERLWSRCVLVGRCWIWQGSVIGHGYGQISVNGKPMYTHRAAWTETFGPIPDGLEVLHRCDTPPCCNPFHLFLGTQSENMEDMWRKGRGVGAKYA